MAAGGSVSVAALFIAGVLPGLLLGASLCAYCLYAARKNNFPKGRRIPLREALRICGDAMWGLMTMFIILTPILLPVVKAIGVDPVHFGMIMMVNLGIGLITPPVGAVLFVGSAVAKLRIEQVVQAMWPFFIVLFIVLILVTYIPAISLWLPRMFGV